MVLPVYNISFIIPAYNEEALIRTCVLSIKKEFFRYMISQHKNSKFRIGFHEVIVVDNNSTDDTAKEASSCGIVKIVKCKEKGVTHARQAGYCAANYNIHAYIDADSTIPLGWLNNLEAFNDLNVVAISGPVRYPSSTKFFNGISKVFYFIGGLCHKYISPMMQGGNFVVRKEALDKIGGHSTNIDFYGEDTDLAKRLSKVGVVKLLPKMWNYSSDRRFRNQGSVNTVFKYISNYISISFFNKPYTKTYEDYRE